MTILLTIIHILVCFFLVVVVLLQSGKAADLAGAFGGMGSQTAFGPRGTATALSKATTIAAALFMVTSLSLAIMAARSSGSSGSVLEHQKKATKATTAPAPAPVGPAGVPPIQATMPNGQKVQIPVNKGMPPGAQPGQAAPAAAPKPAAPAPGKK